MRCLPVFFKRKTFLSILLLPLLTITLMPMVQMIPIGVQAQTAARIYLDPSNNLFNTSTTPIGHKWNVTLWIENVIDLDSYQVKLETGIVKTYRPYHDSGAWTNGSNAYTSDNTYAETNVSVNHRFTDYRTIDTEENWTWAGSNANKAIVKFEVGIEAFLTSGSSRIEVGLVWQHNITGDVRPDAPDTRVDVDTSELLIYNDLTTQFQEISKKVSEDPRVPESLKQNLFSYLQIRVGSSSIPSGSVLKLDYVPVRITYNLPLSITRAWRPTWDEKWVFFGRSTATLPIKLIDSNNDGYNETVGEAFGGLGDTILSGSAFSGTGKLGIIEFQIVEIPKLPTWSGSLNIDSQATYIEDSEGNKIPVNKENGSFAYERTRAHLAVDPTLKTFGPYPPNATGQTLDIKVLIRNLDAAWNLSGAIFSLRFNESVIETVNWTVDPLWTLSLVDNTTLPSEIRVNVTAPSSPPSGSVTVLTVKFRINHQGPHPQVEASDLILDSITLINHVTTIPYDPPQNGKVEIKGLLVMPLEVRPNEYLTDSMAPFNIQVWLSGVTQSDRIIGAEFKLHYDPNLLKVLEITEGSFFKRFGDTLFLANNVTDTEEPYIHIGIIMYESGGQYFIGQGQYSNFPEGNGSLTTIRFQPVYRGRYPEENNCTLRLADAMLVKPAIGSYVPTITPSLINGFYKIWPFRNPQAGNITYSPTAPNATAPIIFNASGSQDFYSGFIENYVWNFGDGTGNITVTTQTLEHTYMVPGSYNVTLTVIDNDGLSNSTTKLITVEKLSSTVSIEASPSTIIFGQSTTIKGTVSPSPGLKVTVQYRREGETTWYPLEIGRINSEGEYEISWTPTKAGTYELKSSWVGNETIAPTSDIATLAVSMASSTLTLNIDSATIVIGSDVGMSGSITPARTGLEVTIYYRSIGEAWLSLATVKTDSSGRFRHTWTTASPGTYEVRANHKGDENSGPAQSRIVPLTIVKATSNITIEVDHTSTTIGANVTIRGTLQPSRERAQVALYYRAKGGVWKILDVVETDSNSNYNFTWTTAETGIFEIRASWQGDNEASPSDSSPEFVNVEARSVSLALYLIVAVLAVVITSTTITLYYKRFETA